MYNVEVRRDSAKERQKKVMEYVGKHGNPDVIKEDIVKALKRDKDGSRHTTYKAINTLEGYSKAREQPASLGLYQSSQSIE